MKILIVSDTHGRHSAFDKALKEAGKIDALVHLGDTEGGEDYIEAVCGCPAYVLAGNNDFFSKLEREKMILLGNYKVFLTHGHYYYVASGIADIKSVAKAKGADIVMFGHTHIPVIDYDDGIIALNPGSLTYPRQEGKRPSYILMELDKKGEAHFSIHFL